MESLIEEVIKQNNLLQKTIELQNEEINILKSKMNIIRWKVTGFETELVLKHNIYKETNNYPYKSTDEKKKKMGKLIKRANVKSPYNPLLSMTYDYKRRHLIVGSSNGDIYIYSIDNFEFIKELNGHKNGIYCLSVVDDILMSSSSDKTIKIWNLLNGELLKTFSGHQKTVYCCTGIDYKNVINEEDYDTNRLINDSTNNNNEEGDDDDDYVDNIYLIDNGDNDRSKIDLSKYMFISGSGDRTIKLWTETDGCIKTLSSHNGSISSLKIYKKHILYCSSFDKSISSWDINTFECLQVFNNLHSGFIKNIRLSNDHLISSSLDKTIVIYDLNLNKIKFCLKNYHSDVITDIFAHSNDDILISCSKDRQIRLFNIRTGECIRKIKSHSIINSVFYIDNTVLGIGSDGIIQKWDFYDL